jgi:hypothetical protein
VLAEVCGVELHVPACALPGFAVADRKISTGREANLAQARWRAASSVAGETAFGPGGPWHSGPSPSLSRRSGEISLREQRGLISVNGAIQNGSYAVITPTTIRSFHRCPVGGGREALAVRR